MLFSKRRKVTALAEEWCQKNGAPLHPFNIVTALSALGLLNNEAVEHTLAGKQGEKYCVCKRPAAEKDFCFACQSPLRPAAKA